MLIRFILLGAIFFAAHAWSDVVDQNFILAQQLNGGLTQESFRKTILGTDSSASITALALNHLKSKQNSVLAFGRSEYFCYQFYFTRECFRQVGEKQIQFLGREGTFRLKMNPKAGDLADAVSLEPVRKVASLSLDFLPRAEADSQEFELRYLRQLDDLAKQIQERAQKCAMDSERSEDREAFKNCLVSERRDLIDLTQASNAVLQKELQRLRNSLFIYTQAGWTNLKDASLKAFEKHIANKEILPGLECGKPMSFGKFTVESTPDKRVFKVKTKDGGTYATSFVSSADLDLNTCNLKATTRWPWQSCLSDEAIDKRPRAFYDSCRMLDFACKTKPTSDVLYVGQCESAECNSLTPMRSTVQNEVALANRAGLKKDLDESVLEIQNSMLVAEGFADCCAEANCRNKLSLTRRISLEEFLNLKKPQVVPRPDGKGNGVKETDI